MPKNTAIARAKSPLLRRRVTFWLFLVLVLTLASLIPLGHTITISAAGYDKEYTLIAAGEQSGGDCSSHGGIVSGSHCCSVSSCVVAIASTPATTSPASADTAQVLVRDAVAPGRMPAPFFHPPKLIV